jgi:hypothetical protein
MFCPAEKYSYTINHHALRLRALFASRSIVKTTLKSSILCLNKCQKEDKDYLESSSVEYVLTDELYVGLASESRYSTSIFLSRSMLISELTNTPSS